MARFARPPRHPPPRLAAARLRRRAARSRMQGYGPTLGASLARPLAASLREADRRTWLAAASAGLDDSRSIGLEDPFLLGPSRVANSVVRPVAWDESRRSSTARRPASRHSA